MSYNQIQQELMEIQAQLDGLRQARETKQGAATQEPPTGQLPQKEGSLHEVADAHVNVVDEVTSEIAAQFQELVNTLDKELSNTNPITLLAVFSLGIFIGRILPR